MALARVARFWFGVSLAVVACGGRAIIDPDRSAAGAGTAGAAASSGDRGDASPPLPSAIGDPRAIDPSDCTTQRSAFAASATLIDQEYDRVCSRDSDCAAAPVQTNCLETCVATFGDANGYATALASAGACPACPTPAPGPSPCVDGVTCDRGRCVARVGVQ